MKLKDNQLVTLYGGISLTGNLITAIATLFKTIYSFGQGLGGSIRRISKRKLCSL